MMVGEVVWHSGPDDVREAYRKRVPLPSRAMMVENQRQYRQIQRAVSTYFTAQDEPKLAIMPPCGDCPVDVFHYCETTGVECKKFRLYSGGNKGRECDEQE